MKRKAVFLINLVLAMFMVFSSVSFALTSISVKSITLNKTNVTLTVGKTIIITAVISPKNATKKSITWSSSNKSIAKVDAKGVVTAIKVGIATITAKSSDGKASVKCKVTVLKAAVPIKIVWYWNEGGSIQLPEDSYVCKKIKKDLNIEYVHVAPKGTDYEERLQLLLASQDIPDIITSYSSLSTNLIKWGVAQPIEKYLPLIPNVAKISNNWELALKYVTRKDGHIYVIPQTSNWIFTEVPYIRYDWLKNLGLQVPKTFDELKDVLIKFTKDDPDKNGKNDTFGTVINEYWGMTPYSQGFAANAFNWYQDGNGGATLGIFTARHKDYLKYIKSLIDSGALDKELATTKYDGVMEKLKAGKVGFLYQWNNLNDGKEIQKIQPECDWRPMPPLKGIYDKGYMPNGGIIREEYLVSSKCQNVEAAFKLMDYMADDKSTPDKYDFTGSYWTCGYGERGVHWEVNANGIFDFGEAALNPKIAEKNKADTWASHSRRFLNKFDKVWRMKLTDAEKKIWSELDTYPIVSQIPESDIKKPINTRSIIEPDDVASFSQEWQLVKWPEFFYKAVLGKVDIDTGWAEFMAEAEKAGLKTINENMAKALKAGNVIK